MKFSVAALTAASLVSSVAGHGFLVGPGVIGPGERGTVRNYGAINIDIDSLRNPIPSNTTACRNAAPGPVTPITLTNGEPFTVTLAMSVGAAHIGPCSIEIRDFANPGAPGVIIASLWDKEGCAVPPHNQRYTGIDKSPASAQCPGAQPAGLVTDDMCLSTWTFNVMNADKITCKRCIMRWYWEGWHLGVENPELYDNCADVEVTVGGGSGTGTPRPPASSASSAPASTATVVVPGEPAPAPSSTAAPGAPVPPPAPTSTQVVPGQPVPTSTPGNPGNGNDKGNNGNGKGNNGHDGKHDGKDKDNKEKYNHGHSYGTVFNPETYQRQQIASFQRRARRALRI